MTNDDDGTSSAECVDRVLDLNEPPTRAGVEMRADEGSTTWVCDEGFETRVELPDGISTTMPSRQLSVDSYRAADPTTGPPNTVDVHSTPLGIDEAATLAGQVADDLGIDASELESWSVKAAASETTDDVKTGYLRSRVGYVGAELQVVHQGVSGTSYVHLILTWGV